MKLRIFLVMAAIAALVIYIGPQFLNFTRARDAVPSGVTMGGIEIGGEADAEVLANLRSVFESPILVYHGNRRIVVRPEDIGFQIDAEGMLADAQVYARGLPLVRDFALYLFNQPPMGGDVPLRYTYDRSKLGAWLQDQAARYDNDPTPGRANLETLQWEPGQPGRYTDLGESAIDIVDAFTDAFNREARLKLTEKAPLPPDAEALEAALRQRLDKYGGIYSLYWQDLSTGEIIDVDADTAFAGMSTVKIPILLKLYHDLDLPLDLETSRWVSDTIRSETNSNFAANTLLNRIGNGDTLTGVRVVTDFIRELGYENTFMVLPYDSTARPPTIVTPANRNPEYNTYPDPAMQTTPADIGGILADIGLCAEGKGNLLAQFPDRITPEKCEEIIGWLEQNPMGFLIKFGTPPDARVAHKHGYAPDTQGDVALIYGPEGPYVLSIFVYQYGWVVWDLSNPLMNDLSRLVWNFYLYRQNQPQLPPFEEPRTTTPPSPESTQ